MPELKKGNERTLNVRRRQGNSPRPKKTKFRPDDMVLI